MTKHTEIISFRSVAKQFGSFLATDNVSFTVTKGEVVGFVGVNGAGKTTAINMLLGFTSPTKGLVTVFGKRITPANAHQSHRAIGYVAGDMELPSRLTGKQYIDFVLGQSPGQHSERLAQIVQIFQPQLEKKIGTLSRGNKQKIALVAAFATSPELIILDEPTSGLDPIMQDAFLELIRSERERGTTVFMSSHYLQEVAEVCSRVMLMKNGQVVEDLSADKLRSISGKVVRVVTSKEILPPKKNVKQLTRNDTKDGIATEFVYDGPMEQLQVWLSGIKHVNDIDISERTLEAEFHSLYGEERKK